MTEWQQTHVGTSIHGIDSYDAWPVFKVMGEQWVLVWIAMVFDQPGTGGQKMTLSMLPQRYCFLSVIKHMSLKVPPVLLRMFSCN